MGPPGPGGGINTNPQAGQALSPDEASQFYANGSEDMGPQLYRREQYQGTATSQDHEGSNEDFGKIEKAKPIYLKPGEKPPKGYRVYEGKKGGRFYLAKSQSSTPITNPGMQPGSQDPTSPQGGGVKGPVPPGRTQQTSQGEGGRGQSPPGGEQDSPQEEAEGEEQGSKPYTPEQVQEVLRKYAKRESGHGVETEIEDELELEVIINQTKFALISAGPNPDEREKNLDDSVFRERHDKLRGELTQRGYVFTQVLGSYGDFEDSFLVMTHDADRTEMVELARMMNQESVIYSDHGESEMIYVTGENAGKSNPGSGFSWIQPDAEDYFTAVYLGGKNATVNFSLNIDFDTLNEWEKKKEGPPPDQGQREIDPEVVEKISNEMYDNGRARVDQAYTKLRSTVKKYGGEFKGLEYRLKTQESIKEAFSKEHRKYPWKGEEDLSSHIDDVVRFTATLDPQKYHQGINSILKEFGQRGIEVTSPKNFWKSGSGCYRGVNVKMKVDGKPVELQFHTEESYNIKQVKTHPLYQIARNPPSPEAKAQAVREIKEIYKSCTYPPKMETWEYSK